jgi:hypothetical protein
VVAEGFTGKGIGDMYLHHRGGDGTYGIV